jgi:hypothetical protein
MKLDCPRYAECVRELADRKPLMPDLIAVYAFLRTAHTTEEKGKRNAWHDFEPLAGDKCSGKIDLKIGAVPA